MNKAVSLKKIFLMIAISFCMTGAKAFASDNVLQAIQVDGVKDSYNIILKSDDVAEVQKTVQAPNKMILNLKGIRASKTINTIYNNTSNVDSVVVEPNGDNEVKILVQGANAGNSEVHFDTLKTPLGVLDNAQPQQSKSKGEIVLNDPMNSYRPVYKKDLNGEDEFSLSDSAASAAKGFKNILKSQKANWMLTFLLFGMLILSGIKTIKGKDNEIKVGLTQSLKDREIELYRGAVGLNELSSSHISNNIPNQYTGVRAEITGNNITNQNLAAGNYGVRAYQQGTRSPYLSSEVQKPRQTAPTPSVNLQQVAKNLSLKTKEPVQNPIEQQAPKSKAANIDSMKFLESMTKIYEKNGRADLAQGLKTNIKKAKTSLS